MNVLGLDIGGANVKVSDEDGNVRVVRFPMWSRHQELPVLLEELGRTSRPQLIGLTMTAELADCFENKSAGVHFLVDSVRRTFPNAEVRVWLTSGEFAEPDDVIDFPQLAAAANWQALATWVGRTVPEGPAILLDTGSTTTDIIPLIDGLPVSRGLNDLERLRYRELVYTGARRTPLCAVCSSVEIDGSRIPVAAELFATTQDVHVVLGNLEEDPGYTETADGRPLMRNACLARIARMLCCDRTELCAESIRMMARQFAEAQTTQISKALRCVRDNLVQQLRELRRSDTDEDPQLILSGSGAFLAAAAAEQLRFTRRLDLNSMGPSAVREAACAFAVARLVHERCRDDLLEADKQGQTL